MSRKVAASWSWGASTEEVGSYVGFSWNLKLVMRAAALCAEQGRQPGSGCALQGQISCVPLTILACKLDLSVLGHLKREYKLPGAWSADSVGNKWTINLSPHRKWRGSVMTNHSAPLQYFRTFFLMNLEFGHHKLNWLLSKKVRVTSTVCSLFNLAVYEKYVR